MEVVPFIQLSQLLNIIQCVLIVLMYILLYQKHRHLEREISKEITDIHIELSRIKRITKLEFKVGSTPNESEEESEPESNETYYNPEE